jgi:hypothetical protein
MDEKINLGATRKEACGWAAKLAIYLGERRNVAQIYREETALF